MHVLDNDSGGGGGDLAASTLELVGPAPEHAAPGSFFAHDGHVHYRPEDGFSGSDEFAYTICNQAGLCDTTQVAIRVLQGQPAPDVCSRYTTPSLRTTTDRARRGSDPLDSVAYIGADRLLYIFAGAPTTTESVSFFVNNEVAAGAPDFVATECPFDFDSLGGENPIQRGIWLSEFGSGAPSVTAVILDQDGSSQTITQSVVSLIIGPTQPQPSAEGANCEQAQRGRTDLAGLDLSYCDLEGFALESADLQDAILIGANLTDAQLAAANMTGANLRGATLDDGDFRGAQLQDTNWAGASAVGVDLRGASLQDSNLVDVDLTEAKMRFVGLQSADMAGASLQSADLREAVLINAYLSRVDLRSADLEDAVLINANLRRTFLNGVDLDGADLTNARFDDASGTPEDDAEGATFSSTRCPNGSVATGESCWG